MTHSIEHISPSSETKEQDSGNATMSTQAQQQQQAPGQQMYVTTAPLGQAPISAQYAPASMYSMQQAPLPAATEAGTYEVIPHRVFVGGFPPGTEESDLRKLFEAHGEVREVKVIRNTENGVSKGYGFVTFETDEEARNIRTCGEKLELDGRRLNLGPAMRRIHHNQRYNEMATAPSPMMQQQPQFAYANAPMQYVPVDMQHGYQQGYQQGYVLQGQSPQNQSGVPYMMALPNQSQSLNNTTYTAYPQQPYANMTSNMSTAQYITTQPQGYPTSTTPQPPATNTQYLMPQGGSTLSMTPSSQGATPAFGQGLQGSATMPASYGYGSQTSMISNEHSSTIGRTPTRPGNTVNSRHSSNVRRSLLDNCEKKGAWNATESYQGYNGGGSPGYAQYPSAAAQSYYNEGNDHGGQRSYMPSQQQQQTVGEVAKTLDSINLAGH